MTVAIRKSWFAAAFALAAALGAGLPGAVRAQAAAPGAAVAGSNSIERIDATQTGSGTYLMIQMRDPVGVVPPSFSVSNPARIALDLTQTVNNLGKNSVDINQGDLRSVNVVQAQGRSRVVLNLRRTVTHTVTIEGNVVKVALGPSTDSTTFQPTTAPAATAAAATAVAAPTQPAPMAADPRALRAVDFRRGSEGEGRVVVDLTDPNTAVDIKQQGQTIVIDFQNTSVPDALRRRLDVTDFGTPVQVVNTVQQGSGVRMTIEPRGLWEQNAYQSDTRFVVEVKPVKEDPTRLFQGSRAGYQGERLSLNFQNVDVRSLLQVIADFTNLNIITSDSVQGSITLRLKDVPWDQALDIILQSKGLDMRKNGNVVLIAPREELATKEKLELEARSQIAELEPLRTEAFVINYQKADDVRHLLVDDKQRLLSKRGSVVVDVRTNQMFVQDTTGRLEEVRRLLARIDIPVPQVLIEARIVEASDTFTQNLGARFGFAKANGRAWINGGVQNGVGSTFGTAAATGTTGSTITIGSTTVTNPNFVNLPADGIGGNQPGVIGLTLFNSGVTALLNLEISALEAEGKGKVVSSPRVVTADKIKAIIEQGTEIPYLSVSSGGGIGQIQFRKAVLKLEVTPQITPEGAIFLNVNVNKDTPSTQVTTSAGVPIDTKNVQTQVLVENGGTVVLGGIYTQTERTTVTKVPLLGDIPILGNLFKVRSKQNDRTELMIFITPRVISERLTTAVR